MSRELYRGRSKKVQKLGRDGLIEQDRATGQERRVSQRAADVSFGPERREPERAAPPSQQREHQRRQYQQEVRQAENPAAVSGWEPAPEGYALDRSAGGGYSVDGSSAVTSDAGVGGFVAPASDAIAPDGTAPEPIDAAPSMRGAADMPMMDAPSAADSGPILVRLRGKRPDSGTKPDSERNLNRQGKSGPFRQGPGDRRAADAESENRNRLQFDGQGRLSPHDSPARLEGDSVSPSLRGAADKPLTGHLVDHHADRSTVRDTPPKFRQEPGGRLQFGGEQEAKPESRQDAKRQQVRQFAGDAVKDAVKPDRLNFETARTSTSGTSGAVPEGPRLRFVPEGEPFSDTLEDEEQETETDAVEAALDAAIPLRNAADALRPPAKGKERNGNRLHFNKDRDGGQEDRNKGRDSEQESRAPGDRRQESGETAKRRQGERFRTESGDTEGKTRPSEESAPDWMPEAVDEGPETAADFTPEDPFGAALEPEESLECGDAGGRLRFGREKPPDRTSTPKRRTDRRKSEPRQRADRKQPERQTAEKGDWTPVDFRPAEDGNTWEQSDADAMPLYAEIDGQFVREEIILNPTDTEERFQRNRATRQNRGPQTAYRNAAYSTDYDRRFHADGQTVPPAWDGDSRTDGGAWRDSGFDANPSAVVIEAGFTVLDDAEEPPAVHADVFHESAVNESAESGEESEKRDRKKCGERGRNRPPVQRMEDGEKVRFDADWQNDSGSQNGKKKPEVTEEKSRLRYGEKPSKLTDDSQSSQKKNRLYFGFGKNAAASEPAKGKPEKDEQNTDSPPDTKPPDTDFSPDKKSADVGNVSSADMRPGKDGGAEVKPDNPPGALSQKRLSARIEQRQAVRRGQERKPVSPSAYHPLALPPAETDRPKQRQKADRTAAPDDGELWTRTRRKPEEQSPSDDSADGFHAGQRKRQRLQFEPEPRSPVIDPEDGYTRTPPKQADGQEPKRRKPRLRFEDEQPEDPSERLGKPPQVVSGEQDEQTDEKREKPRHNRWTDDEQPEDSPVEEPSPAEGAASRTAANRRGNSPNPDGTSGANGGASSDGAAAKQPPTREDRQVTKAERRVEKAGRKLDKARSKLPAKRRIKLVKNYDETTGKVKHRLQFEKEYLPEGVSAVPLPLRGIGGVANSARVTLLLKGHQKIREVERDNVGVESAHKAELLAEQSAAGFLRWNHNRLRSRPYRAVRQAERTLEREQVNLEWRRTLRDHPELQRKHALAKWAQKQRIKRKYAAAVREAKKTQQHTQTVLNETGQIIRSTIKQIIAKKSILATVALLALIVLLFSAGLTSCMAMLSSSQSSYISVSYMADEEDITEADLYYSEMETDLQIDIDNTEINHPGYDEYRYNVGQIAHSPFELLAYLSTKYNAFKYNAIKSNIEALFWQQYTLTRTVVVETRSDGQGGSYPWYVLVTTLTVRPLSSIASATLEAGEETTRYGLYMQTYGDRQAFGNPFDFAWLGRVSSLYGYRKHPMTGAKNLHRGIDIGAPEGTEIKAIQDGRVVTAGEHESYGLYVVIEGEKGYSTLYAHCSRLDVHVGQRVKRGDVIAAVGSTGDSSGPHLHLETKLDGEYLNPIFFVETGGSGGGAVPGGGVVIPDYPGEAPTDETFARMLEEAEKYLGYPYVWGGSNPSTSFDCSGFVSWVINHSGWNVGRLGAQGLCNLCTPVSPAEAKPGDLVFFRYTYNAPIPDGATHVGIYVGNNTMIHCGNPISYASLNTSYWQSHFYLFGRLPTP